ncbi:protein CHROMATIN REMODELING 8-like isoform X1 [Cucurbita pepo subsp. pepo]|uniref:protein CHROMATIN REMODELING 8-like isoform X1 n=1 Tax=Cucurbita pepo subsp. pepo TaxID=3664 RepID=UPI000C9D82ED|nr:protein CHROMATIN REMODELING 8-like isoform X1 [Cucurbita pepo subsp. pepo]XP_023554151.1 protein CHROMATIN REMODELING 8-like isoform X1 [Cucurbita pepo subsp. pepo]XP_023554152.1 protein CHROMATIN REMODELING 8-like isoform X1 [Cucurbita pepo subsp. pepo]XP_023554153.1 protein CHROMATIN REMODELING 8-like isoform X1 [Cucurbita pepo subsp. pepo]
MEEEEDRIFLNSLGVTSANPEDIERDLIEEAKKNSENGADVGGIAEENACEKLDTTDLPSASHVLLHQKLRAVEYEIDAVASTVESGKKLERNEQHSHVGADPQEHGREEDGVSASADGLQHALAVDRLRSLKKTQQQLKKELSHLNDKHAETILEIVKDRSKPKRKSKEVKKSGKNGEKRLKVVSFDEDNDFDAALDAATVGFVETERDELVRKGILTPFHKLKGFERRLQNPGQSSLQNPGQSRPEVKEEEEENDDFASDSVAKAVQSMSVAAQARPTTKLLDPEDLPKLDLPTRPFYRLKKPAKVPLSAEDKAKKKIKCKKTRRPLPDKKYRKQIAMEERDEEAAENMSDGLHTSGSEREDSGDLEDDVNEPSSVTLEGGLKIPQSIFDQLFDYQKVGVQWLWELHCQRAGGIIGDEMGLGKTVQVLAFLGALHFSNIYKPSIIVCPVTLVRQWKREARKWCPDLLVEILHDSAHDPTYRKMREKSYESDESEDSEESDYGKNSQSKGTKKWDSLINRVLRSESGMLITTYEQLRLLGGKLLDIEWGYAVLDEGHRIRNPNAEVTLVCKQLQTVHRIIMTGSPIQNKLTELWSLFDFVFPGKLGVLPVFEAEFAVPISVGGYANASPLQVSTAYRCAVVLRDLIMPYLLRRMKADVNAHLPKKTEHVLFCSLTSEQRSVYRAFLASSEVESILDGNRNSLSGIDVMRKICNHPDLLEREHSFQNPDYGNPERSGKMKVVEQVLKVWKEQGHRVLLFAQTQQMLDILERFMVGGGYTYRRMDGGTPVKQRMALIDEFNNSCEVFVFILTTKVGGLGTNLTGADRVIIFDPDWNPSTDMQARERAWRIGQQRDVTVYRLITRGTIEEKVYHRQIYKHFLTNRILKNPQQRRFFKARDMKDLFTLNEDAVDGSTETSNIFSELTDSVNVVGVQKNEKDEQKNGGGSVSYADSADEKPCKSETETSGRDDSVEMGQGRGADEDENILKSLFDAHGIHSAVNHDIIFNADDGEKIRLEEQASQVARRAAEALRQSRILRSNERISVPTWTGKAGTAGAPSSVRRKFGSTVNSLVNNKSKSPDEASRNGASHLNGLAAGTSSGKALSSAELLAKIRGNQERALSAGLEHHQPAPSSSSNNVRGAGVGSSRSSKNLSGVQPEVLIRQICTFIQQRGGSADSASIVQHFKERIPSNDLPLFKNLLKEIAILERSTSGSFWVLKAEYKQ